jgi:tRNA nucleotidyltransferase (CCA-adding enzyme)
VANKRGDIDAGRLAERMEKLPGVARLREAAASAPADPAYLVGGAVRDLLLGRERADLDVVVEGDLAPLAAALGGELQTHERFATATVREGETTVDLATARAETYAQPGALPDVAPADLEADLARRDFTINAMAVPLTGEPRLIDPHAGLADLEAGVLRVLHSASFRDDPTRALRAARYAARLDLTLEPETEAWLREADLGTVSDDRVQAELARVLREPGPEKALGLIREWGVLPQLDPEGPERAATVAALASSPPWAGWVDPGEALLLAISKPAEPLLELAAADPGKPSEAVRLASEWKPAQLLLARALGGGWLDRYADDWRQVSLEIDGADLLEAGVPEGPAVGRGLQAALDAKLDGEISGREAELAYALRSCGK